MAPAAAETPACTGKDLIADLREHDPKAYAALRAEADAIPNNHGLFWKIESVIRDRTLLSLRHRACRPIRACMHYARRCKAALDKASTVIVESTEALTATDMAKNMFKVAGLMVLPGAQTLDDVIPADDLAAVKAFYEKEGGYEAHFKYRPYMLAMTLSYAACEVARQTEGLPSLDAAIATKYKAGDAKLAGLETLRRAIHRR